MVPARVTVVSAARAAYCPSSCIGAFTLRRCVSVHARKRASGPTTCTPGQGRAERYGASLQLLRLYSGTANQILFAVAFEKSPIV